MNIKTYNYEDYDKQFLIEEFLGRKKPKKPNFFQPELIHKKLSDVDNKELGDIVKKIWDYAEKVNHHPDIFLTYSGIKISLFTHDEFGVTEKDINFARSLDKLY